MGPFPLQAAVEKANRGLSPRAASGNAAAPPASVMNSRRRMCRPGQDHAKVGQRLACSGRSGMRRDVRFGSKADMGGRLGNVDVAL